MILGMCHPLTIRMRSENDVDKTGKDLISSIIGMKMMAKWSFVPPLDVIYTSPQSVLSALSVLPF
jgi:hypothetical protein